MPKSQNGEYRDTADHHNTAHATSLPEENQAFYGIE
jgi:hypothetical protein